MTTILRRQICAVAVVLTVWLLGGRAAQAQCPDRIPTNVISSMESPDGRAMAAQMPPITAGFIAQNGGIATMIQQVRAQIDEINSWLNQEEANQRSMAQQGLANHERARTGRELLRKRRDELKLNQAVLRILECQGGAGSGSQLNGAGSNRNGVSAAARDLVNDAERGANQNRQEMVDQVQRGWHPPRNYSEASSPAAVNLEDPFAAPPDECRPSIVFREVRLSPDGASINYQLSATHSSPRPCTVSFGIRMTASGKTVQLPSRTLVIQTAGATLSESIALPVAVDSTTQACAVAAPLRNGYEAQRDQLAAKYQKIQALAQDTIASRRALERSVTSRDIGNAILGIALTVDTLKLGLGVVSPAAGNALGFGQCVGVELATYVGKTVAACSGKNTSECTDTVLTDGTVWVEKNLACAFKETFDTVDKLVDVITIGKQARDFQQSIASRSKTLEVVEQLNASVAAAATRLDQIRRDRSYIDETIRQLDASCRSPRIELTAVDVKPLATSGK